MPEQPDFSIATQDSVEGKSGATATFPYDHLTVERFRAAFPGARWREDLRAWFVPGSTAERRLNQWLGRELSGVLAYADDRGRDAFAFQPSRMPFRSWEEQRRRWQVIEAAAQCNEPAERRQRREAWSRKTSPAVPTLTPQPRARPWYGLRGGSRHSRNWLRRGLRERQPTIPKCVMNTLSSAGVRRQAPGICAGVAHWPSPPPPPRPCGQI